MVVTTAGTADLPVADKCTTTLWANGIEPVRLTDVGVAGVHRLLAVLIESMFGVTTSDDYRPVTWMGRYPVDVTTMLVGVHIAVRF